MKQNNKAHTKIISECLTRMRLNLAVTGWEVLAGGISGSHTYRVQLATEPVILKATCAGSEPYVLQRAQREFEFYHTLAGSVPLRVPQLLSSCSDSAFGICILLAAYQPSKPAIAWQEQEHHEMAKQLAGFHALFWQKTEVLSPYSWLRKPSPGTDETEIQQALDAWRGLRNQPRLENVLTAGTYESLCNTLEHIPTIDNLIQSFPTTLCHGDCHIDNLLRDEQGSLIWADWQEVGLGHGPEDLSFFFQRALHAGGVIPFESVIAVYQEHLETRTGDRIPQSAVKRVVDGSELRTSLLQWPFYLMQSSVEQISSILNRIEVLTSRLV
jgi:thiamine kinase-like enzyme